MEILKQPEIVRRVEGLFALADQLEVRLAKAGQLVPQDPHDEPAEKLLERVRCSTQKPITSHAKNSRA
jgi:type I restriction enzyme S subunit